MRIIREIAKNLAVNFPVNKDKDTKFILLIMRILRFRQKKNTKY